MSLSGTLEISRASDWTLPVEWTEDDQFDRPQPKDLAGAEITGEILIGGNIQSMPVDVDPTDLPAGKFTLSMLAVVSALLPAGLSAELRITVKHAGKTLPILTLDINGL